MLNTLFVPENRKRRKLSYGMVTDEVFSRNLFDENLLVTNRSLNWKASSSSFSFDYDSVPYLIFNQPIDLTCIARDDTLVIRQTTGQYFPLKTSWIGKDGLMDWEKAGYSMVEVYAELSDYRINTSKAGFKADSVLFYNLFVFDEKTQFFLSAVIHIV